jgi:hypothetical protein
MPHRIVICFVMSALEEVAAAPRPVGAPAFFSKSFQNFKLSSAAVNEIKSALRTSCRSTDWKLTSSSQHLTVGAKAAVQNTALVRRNLNIAD